MQKNILWIIVVVVGIGGLWLVLSRSDNATQSTGNLTTLPVSLPTPTPMDALTELVIEDIQVGTGAEVKSGDTVVMHYRGTLTNGTVFDSSYDRGQPFETQIGVGAVIRGWDEGVPGMKVGGKRKLMIPSNMAYGTSGAGGVIGPNADLIFEVELVEVK